MIRPKSGSNWKGTLYEYEKKTKNSCYLCSHANEGFCSKQNVDIRAIGAGFYRHCKYYDAQESEKDDDPSTEKLLDIEKHKRAGRDLRGAGKSPKESAGGREPSSTKVNDLDNASRYHEKIHIGGKHKPNARKKPGVKSLILRKILNDEKITVRFVDRVSFTNKSSTSFEVTAASSTGKLLSRAKKGDLVEFNGYRCMVHDMGY